MMMLFINTISKLFYQNNFTFGLKKKKKQYYSITLGLGEQTRKIKKKKSRHIAILCVKMDINEKLSRSL